MLERWISSCKWLVWETGFDLLLVTRPLFLIHVKVFLMAKVKQGGSLMNAYLIPNRYLENH